MRIRFAGHDDCSADAEQSRRLVALADTWIRLARATRPDSREAIRALAPPLERLEHRLELVPSPRVASTARWLISTGGARELRPLVEWLVARASSDGVDWLDAHAAASPASQAVADAERRLEASLDGARVRIGFVRGHLLEVVVLASCFQSARDQRAIDAVEMLVEDLLGERVYDHWIAGVGAAPAPRPSPLRLVSNEDQLTGSYPLLDLPGLVALAIEGLLAGLPERPWSEQSDAEQWTLLEAEPELASDYAAQDDVAIATTRAPELLKCYLQRSPFSSLRFSRHDEVFAFVKVDSRGDSETRLAARRELEEQLGRALGPGRGAVIGNGLGVRYAYVDLALEGLERSLRIVREVTARCAPSERAWIQFFDSDWSAEWVGVHASTPPPPR